MTESETKGKKSKAPSTNAKAARHTPIKAQNGWRLLRGILWRTIAVVAASSIAIGSYAAVSLTGEIKTAGLNLLDSNGQSRVTPADLKGPINMLLIGSDTRLGQGANFGNETSVLADVIILLHVSADRKNAVAMSFPRDTMVPWPECPDPNGGSPYLAQSLGQINATIANGGPGCTLLTVEKLTGLKIPYLAMIDFKGVIEMSNAIGGVEVCVANDIKDPYTHTNLKAGKHVLLGKQALQFLRTRHGIGDGSDLSRISNQQVYMTSLVRKIKDQGVLSNPAYLYSLASAAARNMKLSSNLTDLNVMVGLAQSLKNVDLKNISFIMLPSRTGLPAPYQGRVAPVYEKANKVFELLRKDKPIVLTGNHTGVGVTVTKPKPGSSSSPSPSSTATSKPLTQSSGLDGVVGSSGATTTCSNG
mgnify:CR=1 FL=1